MARLPVEAELGEGVWVTPHGSYLFPRNTPSDGGCGISGHPCMHHGIDLGAATGTAVVAPERGEVWYAQRSPMRPPLRGYQPGAVIFRGVSGVFHVLGHLVNMVDADHGDATPPVGGWRVVDEGAKLGEVGEPARHVHWEVRTGAPFGPKVDPAAWLASQGSAEGGVLRAMSPKPKGGDWLGLLVVAGILYLAAHER